MDSIWDDPNLPSDKATAINKERMAIYGDPAPNMVVLAKFWSAVFGVEVTPPQAAMGMICVKMMRELQGNFPVDYPDNLEDICGFTNVLYRTKEASRGTQSDAA